MRAITLCVAVLSTGCVGAQCEEAEQAQADCFAEAEALGELPYGYQVADYACDIYANPLTANPITAAFTPEFGCIAEVWRSADCSTQDGVLAAQRAQSTCD